jgi:hypothetical protein
MLPPASRASKRSALSSTSTASRRARSLSRSRIVRYGIRRQDKFDVRRRLLERLQQRIEGRVGQLMGLVDNVNLEAVARRPVAQILDDRARIFNLAVSGAVDLVDVERAAAANLDAGRAFAARLRRRTVGAVQASRENPRRRSLADAANPGEQKRVRDAAAPERFAERAGRVLLADQLREALGPPFAREYQMGILSLGHREISCAELPVE